MDVPPPPPPPKPYRLGLQLIYFPRHVIRQQGQAHGRGQGGGIIMDHMGEDGGVDLGVGEAVGAPEEMGELVLEEEILLVEEEAWECR